MDYQKLRVKACQYGKNQGVFCLAMLEQWITAHQGKDLTIETLKAKLEKMDEQHFYINKDDCLRYCLGAVPSEDQEDLKHHVFAYAEFTAKNIVCGYIEGIATALKSVDYEE